MAANLGLARPITITPGEQEDHVPREEPDAPAQSPSPSRSQSPSPAPDTEGSPSLSYRQQGRRLTVQFPDTGADELCIEWGDARIILGRDGRVSLEGKDVVVSAKESHTVLAGRILAN